TEFIPIGTTISLLPRVLEGGNVELNIMINVSDLVGYEVLNTGTGATGGNTTGTQSRVPVTTSRDYSGQAIVASGNTLAIGGLEAMNESEENGKVPILGDIPLLGYLFKRKQ